MAGLKCAVNRDDDLPKVVYINTLPNYKGKEPPKRLYLDKLKISLIIYPFSRIRRSGRSVSGVLSGR